MKAQVCSRVKEMNALTGDVLARPAKDLPLKVIRDLGHMLHRAQYNSGNWETIAEDLGYGYEEIKQFNTMANVRQEVAPGELMLRDWVQRINGRTLFVLRSALVKAERLDCVEYLESEIYKRIVCMDLMICVRYEDCRSADHLCVTACAESNLLNSLQRVLDQPAQEKYIFLDSGVSWTGTLAKEFKGRQLMLMRNNDVVRMEQDPTIDSSGIDVSGMDETCLTSNCQISVTSASIITSSISVNQLAFGTSQPSILTGTQNEQDRIKIIRSEPDIHFQSNHTTRQGPILAGNFLRLYGDNSVRSTTPPRRGYTYRAQSMQDQTLLSNQTNRQSHSSNSHVEHLTRHNNLNKPYDKAELNSAQKNLNIIVSDRKIHNVRTGMEAREGNSDMVRNISELDNAPPEDFHNPNEIQTSMECNTDVDTKEGRDIGEYKCQNKCGDFDMVRHLNKDKNPDVPVNNEFVHDNKCMKHKTLDICVNENFRDLVEHRDFGEYRDPNEYREPSEYRGPNEYRDPNNYRDPNEYRDPSKCRTTNEYRDHSEYRDPNGYRDPNEYRDPSGYRDLSEYRDPSELRNPNEYKDPSLCFDLSENKDFEHCKCQYRFEDKNRLCGDSSEYSDANADMHQDGCYGDCKGLDDIIDTKYSKGECDLCMDRSPNGIGLNRDQLDNEDRFISEGFDTSDSLLTDIHKVGTNSDQPVEKEFVTGVNNDFKKSDEYQYAREELHGNDDSITHLKLKFCSENESLTNTSAGRSTKTSLEVKESHKSCNINCQGALEDLKTLSDFESGLYNAHPELQRDFSIDDSDMCHDGDCNGNVAFKKDSDLVEGCQETRVYLDFNKYYQGNTHTKEEDLQESEVVDVMPVIEPQTDFGRDDFQAHHRPPAPRRFISVAPCTLSNKARERQMYERLQRGVSCPSDITYEKSLAFLEEKHMVTIADVFSPVTEESKIADFEMASSTDELQACSSSDSIDSLSSKRHSLPIFRKEESAKRTKLQRHTIHHGDKSLKFLDGSGERFSITVRDSPPLPPRGQMPNLNSGNTLSRSGLERSNTDSSLSAAEELLVSGYICKVVIGGKSSRSTPDNLLADDKLFTHYNTLLHNFPGWSPRETEHTIEKTMADTLSTDGYYILWYIRARKSLVVSVSFRGELVNYRVHTKVLSGKLHYYVTYGRYFEDLKQLLQHYLQYGVRAPGYENSQSAVSGYRIPLSCPVFVQYEKRPAVSV